MITLDHIRKLDQKVTAAISTISALKGENDALKDKLGTYERRIQELEKLVDEFKEDQSEIEQGILNALSQLDKLEDDMNSPGETVPAEAASAEAAEPQEAAAPEEQETEESGDELDIF
jgi:DNA repair exonuclease SbcCD ATPase subunit